MDSLTEMFIVMTVLEFIIYFFFLREKNLTKNSSKMSLYQKLKYNLQLRILWYLPLPFLLISIFFTLSVEFNFILKVIVFFFSLIIAYKNFKNDDIKISIIFIIIAFIYNFIEPIYFPRMVWQLTDLIVILILIGNSVSFYKIKNQNPVNE